MNDLQPASSRSHPEAAQSTLNALDGDLDARILAAEHAVIERDRRVRDNAAHLATRLRESARYSGRIAAVAAFGSFGLGWWMARGNSRPPPPSGKERAIERHTPALAQAPWAGIVPLLWPLLPLEVRSRMNPGLASFITGLGLPMIARYLGRRQARATLREQRRRHPDGAATHH